MKFRFALSLLALVIVALVVTACGTSATPAPTPTQVKPTVVATSTTVPTLPPPPTVAPTAVPPTSTPIPPTPTATPIPPKAYAKSTINVRQGPGTTFSTAGQMPIKTESIIIGKNEDGKWLQVAYPDASHPVWVSSQYISVTGVLTQVPVIAVALPPTATPGTPTATKVAAATTVTATAQSFPAAKGLMAFVSYVNDQKTYSLNNLFVNPRSYSGAYLLGASPVDLRISTNAQPFAWAPNGSRLAFVYGQNGLQDVLRVTNSAGEPRDLVGHGALTAPGGISSPTWSPDSTTIAYIGMDSNYAAQGLYTINAGGGTESLRFQARNGESFRGLAWGKTWMAFVSNLTGSHEIWRLNSDFTGPMQLTNDKRENGSPAWSPDGKMVAFYSKRADNSYQIMVMNGDGTGERQLTNTANNWSPTWSPDGNWIAFASTRNGRLDVWAMDKNGGNLQLLTDKFSSEGQLPGSWR